MSIDVLALVRLTPDRVAALTAAGYAVREGTRYASRIDALREPVEARAQPGHLILLVGERLRVDRRRPRPHEDAVRERAADVDPDTVCHR